MPPRPDTNESNKLRNLKLLIKLSSLLRCTIVPSAGSPVDGRPPPTGVIYRTWGELPGHPGPGIPGIGSTRCALDSGVPGMAYTGPKSTRVRIGPMVPETRVRPGPGFTRDPGARKCLCTEHLAKTQTRKSTENQHDIHRANKRTCRLA